MRHLSLTAVLLCLAVESVIPQQSAQPLEASSAQLGTLPPPPVFGMLPENPEAAPPPPPPVARRIEGFVDIPAGMEGAFANGSLPAGRITKTEVSAVAPGGIAVNDVDVTVLFGGSVGLNLRGSSTAPMLAQAVNVRLIARTATAKRTPIRVHVVFELTE